MAKERSALSPAQPGVGECGDEQRPGRRILKRHRGANDTARDLLEQCPAIDLIDIDHYGLDTFNDCAESGDLLISKPMWAGIHPQLVNVAVDWPEPVVMHYGLLYPLDTTPAIRAFISRIAELSGLADRTSCQADRM